MVTGYTPSSDMMSKGVRGLPARPDLPQGPMLHESESFYVTVAEDSITLSHFRSNFPAKVWGSPVSSHVLGRHSL